MGINASEGLILVVILAMLGCGGALPLALAGWGAWVARRCGGGLWWVAVPLPLASGGVLGLGWAASTLSMAATFQQVEGEPPESKAHALAEGISASSHLTLAALVAAVALLVASVVVNAVGSLRRTDAA